MDDCLAYSETFTDHLQHLEQMLEALRQAGLKLNPDKCQFGVDRCRILGVVVSEKVTRPARRRFSALWRHRAPPARSMYGPGMASARTTGAGSRTSVELQDPSLTCCAQMWSSSGDQPKKQRSKR